MSAIRTAVFPVAGRGTRFLPATKASPKEMLPVVDKPLIQYAVEEALSAGATKLVFVTGSSKRSIENHFDADPELEHALQEAGKQELLDQVRDLVPSRATCIYVRQGMPLGLGHAVLCARAAVGNEPFFVHLADDLIHSDVPVLAQLAEHFDQYGGSVLGVEAVPPDRTGDYGIVAVRDGSGEAQQIDGIVEKPSPDQAPSNLGVVGRYVLTPAVFDRLAGTARGTGDEIQLTGAISALMDSESVYALPFTGKRYDCGSKLGYLQATVEYALRHPDLGPDFRDYVQRLPEHEAWKQTPGSVRL